MEMQQDQAPLVRRAYSIAQPIIAGSFKAVIQFDNFLPDSLVDYTYHAFLRCCSVDPFAHSRQFR